MRDHINVDITNCDKDPIHLIGKIQPHGFLLVFDGGTLELEQGSENVKDYLYQGVEELLGKPLQFFLPEEGDSIAEQLKLKDTPYASLLSIKDRKFFAFIHDAEGKIILECEPYQPLPEKEVVEYGSFLASLLAGLNKLDSLESISELVADAIQAILDIDRVLVFRFDQDWHAEVVAEKIKWGVSSYFGHHFPASDIPAPARALLEVKHIRHIPDIAVHGVALTPYLNPATGKPTDVLQSELRYPSEVHLEYLKNMNVFASISFSVIVKGKLWGLVSCTNEAPKLMGFQKRQLCDQVVKAYANTLISSKEKRDYQQFQHFKFVEKKIIQQLNSRQDIFKGLREGNVDLLSMTEADGAAILLNGNLLTFGLCPEDEHIFEIADWLSKNNTETLFHTRELSACIRSASNYQDKACGLMALEISRFNKEYIFYFKPEVKVKRIWAGNPEKPLAGEDLRIHPRKSFEKWEEEIKGKSYPWNINELEIGQILLKDVVAIRLRNQNKDLAQLNEKYQAIAHRLEIKNTQLQDFTRIITHNLRSPLANIQGLYAIYKSNPALLDADAFINKVNLASDNMLATIEDLNAILKAGTEDRLQTETINLRELIGKELHNLDATIIKTEAEVELRLMAPELKTHKVYLESIMHNLLSNALKYSSPERKPIISVKSWQEGNKFYVSVADNGVGIDLGKYGHKLFGVYQTFHENPNARGVGLYLTKMQVESLEGSIEVKSQPEAGSTFTICFDLSRANRE